MARGGRWDGNEFVRLRMLFDEYASSGDGGSWSGRRRSFGREVLE